MSALRSRFEMIADLFPDSQERGVILAALHTGATLAMARVREVGGGYPGGSDVKSVEQELTGEAVSVTADAVPTAAPSTLPEQDF